MGGIRGTVEAAEDKRGVTGSVVSVNKLLEKPFATTRSPHFLLTATRYIQSHSHIPLASCHLTPSNTPTSNPLTTFNASSHYATLLPPSGKLAAPQPQPHSVCCRACRCRVYFGI
ncbi:hypothetical protein EVA_21720 [gut metagenome]|uniref:Uncharacterized protein n=1 Tax=gut metagenome TaxID=749906 RepID=J9F5K6_9ZZZZ